MGSSIPKFDIWVNGTASLGNSRYGAAGWIIRHHGWTMHNKSGIVTATDETPESIKTLAKAYGVVKALRVVPVNADVKLCVCDDAIIEALLKPDWPCKPTPLEDLLKSAWNKVHKLDVISFTHDRTFAKDRPFIAKSAELSRKAFSSLGL